MPAYANAPCFANYDQSEEAPDAAVVVPGLVNHALGHPRNSFTYGTALTEIFVRCTFSTRLYHSMPFAVRLLQAAGSVMRKGDVRRQLGTSTNTADQIQTCNGGFERNDGTKKWYVSTVLKLWSWWKRLGHVQRHAHVKNIPS